MLVCLIRLYFKGALLQCNHSNKSGVILINVCMIYCYCYCKFRIRRVLSSSVLTHKECVLVTEASTDRVTSDKTLITSD